MYSTVFYSQSCDQSIIYRGPNFLAVVWFGSTPAPSPPLPSANCLSCTVFLCVACPAYWRERGRTWSRIIPPRESLGLYKSSILSACGQANQERCAHCQKFMLSQENHTVKTVKCYGEKLSKITQIYCLNILPQYFNFCTAFSGYKNFIFVGILLYEIQKLSEANVKNLHFQ